MEIAKVKDKTETIFTFFETEEEGKVKAGNMVRNGYLQVSEFLGKGKVLAVSFKKSGQIVLDNATNEEIESWKKFQDEQSAVKKTAGGASKATRETELERMAKDGLVHKVGAGDGKTERWEFKKPYTVKENDQITCLRKSGTFKVKEVRKDKNVIVAIDPTNANHFFNLNEVAPAEKIAPTKKEAAPVEKEAVPAK